MRHAREQSEPASLATCYVIRECFPLFVSAMLRMLKQFSTTSYEDVVKREFKQSLCNHQHQYDTSQATENQNINPAYAPFSLSFSTALDSH